ncbi:MAG TPA: DUF3105 domain-containing protein [Acidimicrobiales bacterium]
MGKQARQRSRVVAAEAARRKSVQRRRRPIFIGMWIVVVGALLALIAVVVLGRGSGLPVGTQTFAENNHSHVVGAVHYDHNPPAGGAHSAVWLNCGIYTQPVPNVNAVHSLEHGSVWITYRPTLSAVAIATLQRFVQIHYDGTQRYMVLSPYPGLPAPVVVTAWGAQLRLKSANDPRLTPFVNHFIGGAQGGEQGASCTGGTGTPQG